MILGIIASSIAGSKVVTNSYESLATVTVGAGGASSITFSGISGSYSHLQIRGIARTTDATAGTASWDFRFNSDSGSNYAYHRLYGDGTSVGANGYSSQTTASSVLGVIPTNGNTASTFGAVVIDLLDYSNTNKYKTVRLLGGTDDNSGSASRSRLVFASSLWMSTSAITSISFNPSGQTFAQYSQLALYGIKA